MIVIHYIPNIFDKENRQAFEREYKYQSVEEYFKQTIGFGDDPDEDKKFIFPVVSGKRVEWDYIPSKHDEVIFVNDVTGGNVGQIISAIVGVVLIVVGAVLSPYTGGSSLNLCWMGAAMIAGAAIGMIAGMFAPSTENAIPTALTAQDPFKNSKTYSWDGIQNTIGEGSVIPVVYGRHAIGGVVIEAFVDGDTDTGIQSNTYLNVLLALSEGAIDGVELDQLRINKQEARYFENTITADYRLGTLNQSAMSNFSKIVKRYNISGVHLKYNAPYIYQLNGSAEAAKINLMFPSLFYQSGGSVSGWGIIFLVEYKTVNGSWVSAGEYTVFDNSKSTVNMQILINFPAKAEYLIRITRQTLDYAGSLNYSGDSYFSVIEEIEYAALTYPNTALLGVRIQATDKLSGAMPNISCVIKGRKLKDVRSLSAPEAWSNNPANILYDILTNKRYGLGKNINDDNINIDSLIEFANWCDEIVSYNVWDGSIGAYVSKTEKRYEFNIVLDTTFRAMDLISKICSTCRAVPYWEGDKFKIVIDRPSTPVQMFTMGNIIEDSFEETYIGFPDIPNQVEAQILDEENNYERTTITGFDRSRLNDPINSKQIQLYGFTNKSRAKRELIHTLKKLKGTKKTISFEAGIDAIICQVGDQILFQHQTPQYGWGGRISRIDGKVVHLDSEPAVELGEKYRLRVRKEDNTFEVHDILMAQTGSITSATLKVTPSFKVGDIYTFGLIGAEAKPFRILNIVKREKLTAALTAEEYIEEIYVEDESIDVEDINYSQLGLTTTYELDGTAEVPQPIRIAGATVKAQSAYDIPPYVLDVQLTEKVEIANGMILSNIMVDFGHVVMPSQSLSKVARYLIYYSMDAGVKWHEAGSTRASQFEIRNVEVGATYHILVKPESTYGVTNDIENSTYKLQFLIQVTGKAPIPANVQNFMGAQVGETIRFVWDAVENARGYEVRMNSWEYGVRVGKTTYAGLTTYISTVGDVHFFVKAVNLSGDYSVDAAECVINIARTANMNILFEQDNKLNGWEGTVQNFDKSADLLMDNGQGDATYYPNMIIFNGSTRTKDTIQYAYFAYIGNEDVWDNMEDVWDDMEAVWLTIVDTDNIMLFHDISIFQELTADYIDVIRFAGNSESVKGMTPTIEGGVSYAEASYHEGIVQCYDLSLQYDVTFPDAYSILFRFNVGAALMTGVICSFTNGAKKISVVICAEGKFWLMDESAAMIEVPLAVSAKDHLRFGISKGVGGFGFYVGNITKNLYGFASGNLDFTKPLRIMF